MKTLKTIAYWVTTVLGPTSFVIGGVLGLRQSPEVVAASTTSATRSILRRC